MLSRTKVDHLDVITVSSLLEAWEYAFYRLHAKKLFVIGGERLYREAAPHCSEIYLTGVGMTVPFTGDDQVARFDVELTPNEWSITTLGQGQTQAERNPGVEYIFQHLVRRSG
ncbi:Dihydrofolate reductase [compost metagenome]